MNEKRKQGIQCPQCFCHSSSVKQTRWRKEEGMLRRRRRCLECGHSFTTYETTDKAVVKVQTYQKAIERMKKALLEGNRALLRLAEFLVLEKADEEANKATAREVRTSLERLGDSPAPFTKRERKRRIKLGISDSSSETGKS